MSPRVRSVETMFGTKDLELPTQITLSPSERQVIAEIAEEDIRDYLDLELTNDHHDPGDLKRWAAQFRDVTTLYALLTETHSAEPLRTRLPDAIAGVHHLVEGRIEQAWFVKLPDQLEKWRPLADRLGIFAPATVNDDGPKPCASWKSTAAGRRWTGAAA